MQRNFSEKDGFTLPKREIAAILTMEKLFTDDGALVFKFFLHIGKKDQKERIKKVRKEHPELVDPDSPYRNFREDAGSVAALENLLEATNTDQAPWTLVAATDRRFAITRVFSTIIEGMEARLSTAAAEPAPAPATLPAAATAATATTAFGKKKAKVPAPASVPIPETPILDALDLSLALPEAEYEKRQKKYSDRLHELQYAIHRDKIPVVMVFEGCDAAGKGGAIIRLDRALNPRCSVVEPVAAPTPEEKGHHYLWRFVCNLPPAGDITIFDRSWYGRVLVERVEGFCTTAEWQRAYDEINAMEEYLVRHGVVLLKFWLQIDQDVQLQRFHERETDPLKKYKITDEDWRNREKWGLYRGAIEEMLAKTSPPRAPWTLVEANDKYYARVKIFKTTIRVLENAIRQKKKRIKQSS
ncbi:MAG: phosphate--AMP phosphotransferase [Methanomicrobiales archaeon]|nr:phosphate--AMP phosphotransferase [Methanomicrobiales archaeon]